MNSVPFSRDILSRWGLFLCPEAPLNFYHHFKTNILRLNVGWLSSLVKFERSFDVSGTTYWIVLLKFKHDNRFIRAYGVGIAKRYAKDAAAYRLFHSFRVLNPSYLMASHLIGFPNVRGHCFLISAVLPLLHSYPFARRLFETYGFVSCQRNLGLLQGNLLERRDIEVSYFWTRLMYTLYIRYFGVSSTTELRIMNAAQLAVRRLRAPVVFPAYADYQNDLELDRVLISGLCSALRDYCNNFYETPGGFEVDAYSDILWKLASEDSAWFREFFLDFVATYACRRCVGQATSHFRVPVLILPSGQGFQEALDNLPVLLSNQVLVCQNIVDGVLCGGNIRRVFSCEVFGFPNVLCFNIGERSESVYIPERVVFRIGGIGVQYTRLASSNCFECWETHDGFSYDDFYHVPVESDVSIGFHTYITMRTRSGFVEMNNGSLYTCDSRLFGRTTPGSIHYYQRSSYDNFIPSFNLRNLNENPEW